MKFSQNFQVGGAHTPGGSLRGFLPSLLDRRSASRRGCRGICSGRLMGMCLRCARCSTVSLKTLPEKAPRRFHFRSKFQVKTFQVEIFARTLVWESGHGTRPHRRRHPCDRRRSASEMPWCILRARDSSAPPPAPPPPRQPATPSHGPYSFGTGALPERHRGPTSVAGVGSNSRAPHPSQGAAAADRTVPPPGGFHQLTSWPV